MSRNYGSTDSYVNAFQHLKTKPRADQALEILRRVASLVKPIMRKHSWHLPVLAEFFPDNANLLGMNINGGSKILLRLRPAHAEDSFLPEEDVIGTMLHELTHNVHGPHDDRFYKLLNELQDEYDALQRSGYSGEGFHSKGNRVGNNVSHDLPPHLGRLKALEAAEKRRKTASVMGTGGRLGGRINTKGLSPRELAAQAAERRLKDEKSCGSGESAEREAAKAAEASVEVKVIDLTEDEDDSDVIIVDQRPYPTAATVTKVAVPQSKAAASSTAVKSQQGPVGREKATSAESRSRPKPYEAQNRTRPVKSSTQWECPACTLHNEQTSLQCGACLTQKPIDEVSGWACLVCGETGMPPEFWTCSFCGTVKSSS